MEGPDLTSSQQAILGRFKSRINELLKSHHDDFYLIKWLRARNWDVESAEKLFRDDQTWRQINEVDKILSTYEPVEVLVKYYPGGYCGVSKEGLPVWVEPMAKGDQRGIYKSVSNKELMRLKIWELEKLHRVMCPELSRKFGRKIDQCVEVVDLDGFGLKHLWKPAVDVLSAMARMAEEHYPDSFRSIIAINAPAIVPIAYNIFKPLLSQNTKSRIKIFGSNYKEHLLKEIDADQLPVHWGGTATDADGDLYCRSKVCMGGPVPEKYYRKNMLEENNDLSKFTSVSVRRGSTLQLDFTVTVRNSLLSWNFYTENNDIGFGVFRRTSADQKQKQKTSNMEVIVPSERVNCHVIPEAGNILCENPGTYVVHFDNSFSYLRSKRIFHFIEIVAPGLTEDINMQLDVNNL